ncbi:hypothetical protein H5V43_22040 (plasmid) [Sphingobium fuliginis]|jgi:hypothetical protein|uniref:Uncharacterized protein n=1 Tax=Sphingobium fuliginis (strain ATCC 27551) TaxID=336203 RepID=A0A7M2GPE1_SPHSA|nr:MULTISPECIES: hypothetical protein [Sphingobium]QOT74551.1 hypothetical protein H5V43_22040 [Sphingobium fuliginis]
MSAQPESMSLKRRALCSRENAERVASQIFDQGVWPVSIIRTGNALQPFRVSVAPARDDHVEVELLC